MSNKISFRRWKLGLIVAVATGLCYSIMALAIDMTLRQSCILILAGIAREVIPYFKANPVEEISLDSNPQAFVKDDTKP